MHKVKHAAVDIAVTSLIILAAVTAWSWTRWILLIYTPLLLVLKIGAVASRGRIGRLKTAGAEAPSSLLHVLYALDVIVLIAAGWWYLAGGWAAIWGLSIIQDRT